MSESNVYEAPQANLGGQEYLEENRDHFVAIARRQKHLLYAFLAYFILAGFMGNVSDELRPILQLIAIPLFLAIIIFNVRLCWKLYGTAGRIIMIAFGIIPIINFIVIIIASSKANRTLKKAGFKVGFMGVKISEIEK